MGFFYVNLPIGIAALILLWGLLPSRPIIKRQLDIFGAVVLGLGLCALQLMLDRGQHKDWFESTEIVAELIFALSAFWIFFIHSRSVVYPQFEPAMVANRAFLVGIGFMLVLGITNVGLSAVLPTMFQTVYGYDVMDTGLLMAPRGCGVLLMMVVTSRLINKTDSRIFTVGHTGMVAGYGLSHDRDFHFYSGAWAGICASEPDRIFVAAIQIPHGQNNIHDVGAEFGK